MGGHPVQPAGSQVSLFGNGAIKTKTIKFELEVCRVIKVELNGIRLKRLGGDTWEYKTLMTKLVSQMRL
jgi:MAP/microtubule affinity-regulating kinase